MRLKEWHKITFIVILTLIVGGIFYSVLFRSIGEETITIKKNSILDIVIAGEVPERTVPNPVLEIFGTAPSISVQDLLFNIRKATRDKRITAILLRPVSLLMGWGKLDEIRNALLAFKRSGKQIYVYTELAGDKEYYLASVADTIVSISSGIFVINGFYSEPVFLKNTLRKIGIEADFVAYGKYKNAPDIFTREHMSDAQREVLNALLDGYYRRYVDTLSTTRKIDRATVQKLIDRGLLSGEEALKAQLIDSLMYLNELKEHLKQGGHGERKLIPFSRYRKVKPASLGLTAKKSFALIYGVGTIVSGSENQFDEGELITSEGMANSIRKAAENKNIKAIILRIDSPGGSGIASDVIWREVVAAREKKPVIVSVSDMAASGGYYISMAADSIVAHPASIVGSIGVFAGKFSFGGLYQKIGMNTEQLTRGKNANFFSTTRKFTPEQRKLLQQHIMTFYNDFITKAAEGRHKTPQEVDKIAQGRVWSGEEGLKIGLVDQLGDFNTAVKIAKKMANIPEDELVRLVVYPRLRSFWERILSGKIATWQPKLHAELQQLSPIFRNIVNAIPHFKTGEPLFLLPFDPAVN